MLKTNRRRASKLVRIRMNPENSPFAESRAATPQLHIGPDTLLRNRAEAKFAGPTHWIICRERCERVKSRDRLARRQADDQGLRGRVKRCGDACEKGAPSAARHPPAHPRVAEAAETLIAKTGTAKLYQADQQARAGTRVADTRTRERRRPAEQTSALGW